jgi:hypothetical protein
LRWIKCGKEANGEWLAANIRLPILPFAIRGLDFTLDVISNHRYIPFRSDPPRGRMAIVTCAGRDTMDAEGIGHVRNSRRGELQSKFV